MSTEVVLREAGELSVEGPVTIGNVTAVVARGIAVFGRDDFVVDLTRVTEVDSAAVSMLLEWQRDAARRNRRMCFANMPQNLQNLIRLYGVSELIYLA
ncbi:MAG: STAS domain-containing protein [Nitrosospira sp.]|nr:STAS domain-containing protein [Nitrosospira sp.]